MGDFLYICVMENNVLYIHTRKTDGVIFYVGIGNKERPKSKRNRNKHWKGIVKKYGYNVQILCENLDWSRACELEKMMIAFYGRSDKGLGTLVNQTDGGDGFNGGSAWNKGITPTEEVKQKISNTLVGKMCGDKNPFYKKKHSDESRMKMSESQRNRPPASEETKLKRSQSLMGHKNNLGIKHKPESIEKFRDCNPRSKKVNINGVIYRSVREAGRQLSIPHETITQRIKSKNFVDYQYV
jgi:group I intron endonuclease